MGTPCISHTKTNISMAWKAGATRLAKRLKNLAAGAVACSFGLVAEQHIVAVLKGEDLSSSNVLVAQKPDQIIHQRREQQRWSFEALMQQPLRNLVSLSQLAKGEEVRTCVWTDGSFESLPHSAASSVAPSSE